MFDGGHWIQFDSVHPVRGVIYKSLMSLATGAFIDIGMPADQPDSDLNLSVWCEFPGMHQKQIFSGTPVECIRVVAKFAEQLHAKEVSAW